MPNPKTDVEILVYGLPKGETERYTEVLLSTKCRNENDVERIKEAAIKDGFHDFRVTRFVPGKLPNFIKTIS